MLQPEQTDLRIAAGIGRRHQKVSLGRNRRGDADLVADHRAAELDVDISPAPADRGDDLSIGIAGRFQLLAEIDHDDAVVGFDGCDMDVAKPVADVLERKRLDGGLGARLCTQLTEPFVQPALMHDVDERQAGRRELSGAGAAIEIEPEARARWVLGSQILLDGGPSRSLAALARILRRQGVDLDAIVERPDDARRANDDRLAVPAGRCARVGDHRDEMLSIGLRKIFQEWLLNADVGQALQFDRIGRRAGLRNREAMDGVGDLALVDQQKARSCGTLAR
ncbi:hypothetical protein [Bradyrhizobium aeschynomenes]|uniref:hypothetical protein n=1 Tax=Bradyrhizobium aeschynomenes TaxID=2734909 RepID=UPI0015530176|nr:hypothetical protein [Bradyrhizobium aeschynomenes]NPV19289.1 hypothetical protein [Bradyrhizobium aeschynomenes]